MTMWRVSLLVLVAVGLTACTKKDDRVLFDGLYFKAKTKRDGDNYANFITTISPASAGIEPALEAGRYEGTKYCLANNFGTSIVHWTVGPDTDPAKLVIVDNEITLRGRCDT